MNFNWNPETKALYVSLPRPELGRNLPFSTKVVDEVTELDYMGPTVVGVQINDVSKRWKIHPLVRKEIGPFRTDLIFDRIELMIRNRIVPTKTVL